MSSRWLATVLVRLSAAVLPVGRAAEAALVAREVEACTLERAVEELPVEALQGREAKVAARAGTVVVLEARERRVGTDPAEEKAEREHHT